MCIRDRHEVTKEGVLIDVCPRCRGVWLDRGELEKIINTGRAAHRDYDDIYGGRENTQPKEGYPRESYQKHGHDHDHYQYKHHKKKKPFYKVLEDIFD
jgi:Zn-finger nucleic acid-binding protein